MDSTNGNDIDQISEITSAEETLRSKLKYNVNSKALDDVENEIFRFMALIHSVASDVDIPLHTKRAKLGQLKMECQCFVDLLKGTMKTLDHAIQLLNRPN